MPSYYARGVSAHLGTLPLEETTTPTIQLRKGETAGKQSDDAEAKLLRSKLLKEEPVYLPGDEGYFELHWLGKAPFMQARAGMDLFEGSASEADQHKPRALVLHLHLSDQTFISGLHNLKTSLKIDVFFNGQLSSCLFMPIHDMRSGVKGYHQVFAGTRIDFLAERPWVVLPPGVAADGTAKKNNNSNKSPPVEHRWQQIAQALQEEARQRGTDEKGQVPPSAQFLRALAVMQIPVQVRDMQKSAGRHFGTVDVVITAGEGKKLTSGKSYLKAPQRLADMNFPLIIGNDGISNERRAIETGRSDSDSEICHNIQPSPEMIDADEQGDSDEPLPKRRAIAPRVLSMQHVSTTSASCRPFIDPPSLLIPPRSLHRSNASPLSAAMSQPSSSFPVASSARRTIISSYPERRWAYENGDNMNIRNEKEHGRPFPKDAPSSHYSTTPPNLFTPRMHPSPYNLHFSDPVLGRAAPSDLMSLTGGSSTSSPLYPLPMSFSDASQHPPFASLMSMTGTNHTSFGSHQYFLTSSLPEQVHPSSLDSQSGPAKYPPSGHDPQVPKTPMFHAPIPNMLPRTSTPLGYQGCMPGVPSYDSKLSASLPPTGLYTVPTKPKHSVSPQKDPTFKPISRPTSTMLVKRLVISGKDGATVVDQRWATTQRIVMLNGNLDDGPPQNGSAVTKECIMWPTAGAEVDAALCRSDRSSIRMNSPPLAFPLDRNKRISLVDPGKEQGTVTNAELIREPLNPVLNDAVPTTQANVPTAVETRATSAKKGDQSRTIPINPSLRTINLALQRRNTSGRALLGVQGRKAAPFVYDDPEEIVREASARLRQSRPSNRPNNSLASEPLSGKTMPTADTVKSCNSATSSPLSSVPATPEPEVAPTFSNGPTQMHTPRTPAPIVQVDGSPERKAAPRSKSIIRRNLQTPSPIKLTSATMNATPKSSAAKKRKDLSRCLPKEPRSPNRLKTASNPPLNGDCVIAYAEGEAQEGGNGVLRQVRGERQGVFTEEYVVFASRFYVAGN